MPRVLDAFAAVYGYQPTIDGTPNPETKAEFAKRQLIAHVRSLVATHESNTAAETARANALAQAESDLGLS